MAEELIHNLALADPSSLTSHLSTPPTLDSEIRSYSDVPSLSCFLLLQSLHTFSSFSGMLFSSLRLLYLANLLVLWISWKTPPLMMSLPTSPRPVGASFGFPKSCRPMAALLMLYFFLGLNTDLPIPSSLGAPKVTAVTYQAPHICSAERESKRAVFGFMTEVGTEEESSSACNPHPHMPHYLTRTHVDPTFSPCRCPFTSARGH